MQVIGITGQTGAGKSTVCKMLCTRGWAHIDADRVAKSLYTPRSPLLSELAAAFGSQILTASGEIDRAALAEAAFASPEATKTLNRIVHPAVTGAVRERLSELERAGTPVALLDAIALFESGEDALCARTVAVVAPESVRLARILERDGLSEEDALRRIRAQHDEGWFCERCDAVIRNYPPYTLSEEIGRVFPL